MMRCETVRDQLSAYLDRALDAHERSLLEQHLDLCSECSREYEELAVVRHAAESVFARDIAEAPPPSPDFLQRFQQSRQADRSRSKTTRRRFSMLTTTMTGVGLAASLLFAFVFWPVAPVNATPAELLRRASERYQRHRDLEFLITPRSEAIDLLGKLMSNSDDSKAADERAAKQKDQLAPFRLILGTPNRLLIDPDTTDEGFRLGNKAGGFDGETSWSYDAETDTITLSKAPVMEFGNTTVDLGKMNVRDANLMSFLSWGFVRKMSEANESEGTVTEVTGPYERRVGHRAFEFDLRSDEDSETPKDKRILTVTVRVVIDPRNDLLEKAEFDLGVGGLSLFNLKCELVGVNRGHDDSLFRYQTHVGSDTKIVVKEETAAEESKEEESKEEKPKEEKPQRPNEVDDF